MFGCTITLIDYIHSYGAFILTVCSAILVGSGIGLLSYKEQ